MQDVPKLLLADDEETFLRATAELLRQEGYECDCASDGAMAASMLRAGHYDVLIADIKMPGNPNLELIQQAARTHEGLPVIIVTAYPSVETAVNALDLPVWGYLRKPLDFDALLDRIRAALRFRHQYTVVHSQRRRIEEWLDGVDMVEMLMMRGSGQEAQVPVEAFLALTMRNIYGALEDLRRLTKAQPNLANDACHLLECPRPMILLEALRDTIDVLQRTKSAFKSKELGALRERLEKIVAEASSPETFRLKPPDAPEKPAAPGH